MKRFSIGLTAILLLMMLTACAQNSEYNAVSENKSSAVGTLISEQVKSSASSHISSSQTSHSTSEQTASSSSGTSIISSSENSSQTSSVKAEIPKSSSIVRSSFKPETQSSSPEEQKPQISSSSSVILSTKPEESSLTSSDTVQDTTSSSSAESSSTSTETAPDTISSIGQIDSSTPATDHRIKIAVGNKTLTATIYDNACGRDLMAKLPLTLTMLDLYDREMCYRFSETLATDDVQYTGYEVGEIVYWPPGHSFVIMYAQNGEEFSMQKLGRIDSGVEVFEGIGDVEITIEPIT